MKKITINKEKIKAWAKEHWVELATGAVAVGTVAAVMIFGRDKENIDPFVIDLNKDDWKDQLKTNVQMTLTEKPLTVRQLECLTALDEANRSWYKSHDVLTKDLEIQADNAFCDNPDNAEIVAVLNGIDKLWIEDPESTDAEKSA